MKLKRRPDQIIGEDSDPYLYRWFLIPKNKFFNVYLHKFLRSDDDRALHDHPWPSLGIILKGDYLEVMPEDPEAYRAGTTRLEFTVLRRAFRPVLRKSTHIHRVELIPFDQYTLGRTLWINKRLYGIDGFWPDTKIPRPKPVWTLFITGPRIRDWGFWCPFGFRLWTDFVSVRKGGNAIGKGCE